MQPFSIRPKFPDVDFMNPDDYNEYLIVGEMKRRNRTNQYIYGELFN